MNQSQLAINSVSTRQSSLEEALQAYAQAGFAKVEFVLPQLKGWLSEGRDLSALRDLLAGHGLRSIGGFEAGIECFSSEDSQRANERLFVENARLIHDLGGGTLVVGTDGPPQASEDALGVIAARLHALAHRIEDLDVSVALEFNWSPVVRSLKSALAVVRETNHPQVGILFDTAHYYTTTTKLDHLNAESVPWVRHVHLNDMRDKPGEHSNCNADRVLPGQGILNLRDVLSLLAVHGYEGDYSIEMFSDELWSMPAAEAARLCYDSLLPYCE